MLPVSSLHEPPAHLLLRDTNEVFVGSLKKEMMENPTGKSGCIHLYMYMYMYIC